MTAAKGPGMGLSRTPAERFLSKLTKDYGVGGCWLWQARIEPNGYGRFYLNGHMGWAHRAAYQLFVGPIPDGMQLDHLCRVRHCVNPSHLEPVTQLTNIRRGLAGHHFAVRAAAITQCKHGHQYTPENTRRDSKGARVCRMCRRAQSKRSRMRVQSIGGMA